MPTYTAILYEVRSKLVHNFTNSSNFMFLTTNEFAKAFPSIGRIFDMPLFDTVEFKEAVIKSYENYLEEVGEVEKNDLRANFMKRYKSAGIIKDEVIGVMRDLKTGNIAKIDPNAPFDPIIFPFSMRIQ